MRIRYLTPGSGSMHTLSSFPGFRVRPGRSQNCTLPAGNCCAPMCGSMRPSSWEDLKGAGKGNGIEMRGEVEGVERCLGSCASASAACSKRCICDVKLTCALMNTNTVCRDPYHDPITYRAPTPYSWQDGCTPAGKLS